MITPMSRRLILALMLAASCMQALHAKEIVDESQTVSDTAVVTTAESSHTVVQEAIVPTPSEALAQEESPLTGAPVEPEQGIVEDTQETEQPEVTERTWWDDISDYVSSHFQSAKSKAHLTVKKMEFSKKYGADAEVDFETFFRIEADLAYADEVREQLELERIVAMQERQRLYEESLLCLALNGYHEARGETADQELATAAVVLNRLSVGFRGATTICEVIYTPAQFSWVTEIGVHIPDTTNKVEKKAWERSLLIARRMLDPDATFVDPSNGALYYYNPSIVDWKYKHAYRQVAVLGSHRFMTEKDRKHPHFIDNRKVRLNPVLFNGLTHNEREALIENFQQTQEVN